MKQKLYQWFAVVLIIVGQPVSLVLAAPPDALTLTYEARRNGQLFANVTETFTQDQGRYRIESVTKGVGIYALLGERRMLSEGTVTAAGLRPLHFESHQGDSAKRALFADFDWASNVLNMKVKGKPVSTALQPGAQDLGSMVYQFMFVQPQGDLFKLPVTTGKKLKLYEYRVTGRDIPLEVPAGRYRTIHLQEARTDEDSKELWLGVESYFLPVKLEMRDEKGVVIEQILTDLQIR